MQFCEYSEFSLSSINKDHMEFLLIISKLYDANIKKLPHNEIIMILDDLENYAYAHFRSEERKYSYSKPALHIIKDNLLMEKLDEYRMKYESYQMSEEQLFNSIFNWLLTHLKNHDTEFNNFLHKEKIDETILRNRETNLNL